MRHFLILILAAALPFTIWAQRSNSPQRAYLNGKDLFNDGKYHLAIEAFKPLTTYTNAFTEYATFYYGLSSYRDGQTDIARNIFLQLVRKFPNWSKKGEALYWLATIYFEKDEYQAALEELENTTDRNLKNDLTALKEYHLERAPIETLKELYSVFPQDADVAEHLAKKLAQPPVSDEHAVMLDDLIEKFRLDRLEITQQEVGPTVMKEVYKVAVCFPFMTRDLKGDRRLNSNQWVLDMYQGIKLGRRKLEAQNISIELFAYDTERDSIKTSQIFSSEEMNDMDLIIGPLYPAPSRLASAFAYNQKINILNPLSSNSQIIKNNPYSFLFQPADETLAQKAANFMVDKIEKDKKVLIVRGSRVGDSIAAYQYQAVLQEHEIEVLMMDPIPTVDAEGVARIISTGFFDIYQNKEQEPPRDDIGHIYVASSNELIVANVISTIDNIGAEVSIMGHEDWLRSRYVDFRQLERLQVYMAAPNFVDYDRDAYKSFQKGYTAQTHHFPDKYSMTGYEVMMFFGKMLKAGGTYFQHYLHQTGFVKGTLFQGFDYQESNDNHHVPVVKFQDGVLTLL